MRSRRLSVFFVSLYALWYCGMQPGGQNPHSPGFRLSGPRPGCDGLLCRGAVGSTVRRARIRRPPTRIWR